MAYSTDYNFAKKWSVDKVDPTPLFKQLAEKISFNISLGEIPPEGKLPPVRYLASELGMSIDTVRAAYKALEEKGLVMTRPHHGTEIISLLTKEKDPGIAQKTAFFPFKATINELLSDGYSFEQIRERFLSDLVQMEQANKSKNGKYLFVECNTFDKVFCDTVSEYLNANIDYYLLNDIPKLCTQLEKGLVFYEAAITTYFHFKQLQDAFKPYGIPVYGLVIELSAHAMNRLVSLPTGAKVGILCQEIHNQSMQKSVIQGIRKDIEIKTAAVNTEIFSDIVQWADILLANHPCEEVALQIKPDAEIYFFYDNINAQSLALLQQELELGLKTE